MGKYILSSLYQVSKQKGFMFVLIATLLLFFSIQPIQSVEKEKPKQVLVFYSYPLGNPWQDKISKTINEELQKNPNIKINILSEFPWNSTSFDDTYAELLIDFYKYKYKDTKIDIILSVSEISSIFLLKHGGTLFPGVPVMSLSSTILTKQIEAKSNWIGIYPELKIRKTIDSALRLQPKTQNVAIVSGNAPTGLALTDLTRQISLEHFPDLNFMYLTGIPMDEIIKKVSNLPQNTIVLYLLTLADSTGKEFIPKEILINIAEAANAPVFALWDMFLGSGVVGGYVISTKEEGKILIDIAFRILKGEKIENIPVNMDLNEYIFNWNQMKRWNLQEQDLPPESIILDREYTFWDQYKTQIIITILVVLIEAFLILALSVQQSRLKTVRKSLTKSQSELENKVLQRIKDLSITNNKLEHEIVEHKEAKSQIQILLEEKELILQEIHHRVKNNMSTTMSFLHLQSISLKNPEAIEALETAGNRVRSMMILYDKLYRGSDFKNISVFDYFTTLTMEIVENFENPERIQIETKIEDFQMDAKTVFNLGIIINELITNTMKYAFPGNRAGKLFLSIETKDNNIEIIMQDNGIGLPDAVNFNTTKSFGLSLVKMLTEQLDGTINIERENGTKFFLEIDNNV